MILHGIACTLRREFIRSMNPPPPPAGSPHDADPARVSVLFLAFFLVRFPNSFFMNFGFDPGPENRPKSHPGAKKCVPGCYFLRFLARAGVLCVFRPIWMQKTMKNRWLFQCVFLMRRVFFTTRQPLILLTGAALQRVFRVYEKCVFSQKNVKKRASNRSPENVLKNERQGSLLGPKIDENRAPEALEIAKSIEKIWFWRDLFFDDFLDHKKLFFGLKMDPNHSPAQA